MSRPQIGRICILDIELELACKGGSCGGISLKIVDCNLHLKRFTCISLTYKLVPVQYWEYGYGLLNKPPRLSLLCLPWSKIGVVKTSVGQEGWQFQNLKQSLETTCFI